MADASTVTFDSGPGPFLVIGITETEAAAGSEVTITLHPSIRRFRILRQVCSLTSGTGTTVDPILGSATAPSGANVLIENDTAAADVDNSPANGATCFAPAAVLYHRSVPDDATADHSITTEYHLEVLK